MSSSAQTNSANSPRQRPSGMRAFIVMFLLCHIPLFIYPVLRLAGWLELGLLTTVTILIPVACSQIISRWVLRDVKQPFVRLVRQIADFILGMSPILLMCLIVAELAVAFSLLEGFWAALTVLAMASLISAIGLWMAMMPVVKPIRFKSNSLASPLRFVQITDVHIGSRNVSFLESVVDRIRKLEPEFVCITGDFIDQTAVPESALVSLQLLKCPVYFTTGNHERYEDLDDILVRLKNLGVQVLRSESVQHRADVQVLGVDDRDDPMQVETELARMNVDPNAFGILMYHRPTGLQAAESAGIDLMISGHTHNGQIFPFNLVVNQVFDHVAGLYHHNQARLYVSQGTGTWGPVMRVGTRSEITLFEIDSSAA